MFLSRLELERQYLAKGVRELQDEHGQVSSMYLFFCVATGVICLIVSIFRPLDYRLGGYFLKLLGSDCCIIIYNSGESKS